jgi:Uma2 family endonuclease
MIAGPIRTAEDFLARRSELPNHGQWVELVRGQIVVYDAPELVHGNVVLNLVKRFAEWLPGSGAPPGTTVRFDVGWVTGRGPDTLRFPAACLFRAPPDWVDEDETCTESIPALVVEVPGDNSRRVGLGTRLQEFLDRGAEVVWVVDPSCRGVHVVRKRTETRLVPGDAVLEGGDLAPGLRIPVGPLFDDPAWWSVGVHRKPDPAG